MRNILAHPHVGLIFLIPTVRETLRVNGAATVHDAPELREQCTHRGRLPLTVIRVAVEEVFLHCAKALLRSKLWQPDAWPEARPVPPMGEMIRDHGGLDDRPPPRGAGGGGARLAHSGARSLPERRRAVRRVVWRQ